ncbi:hypothetical protein CAL7716_030140 [Calothrix sp. PCC 7716]|nr:hypothetical protein CAL7716_030140 [Calothrix sp. PCC 7716]
MLGAIFERFVEESPISVMVRGLMEQVLAPEKINQIFETNAQTQYTRELLFSSVVDLMSLVVCGIHPSVNAAYRAKAQQLNFSRTAVYDKLNRVDTCVSAAIVRETGMSMASLIELIGGKSPSLLAPYKIRVIDGNCLEGTDHRLEVLRNIGAVALPGKSLVILDPELRLAINVFPCEDGHAQERSLFNQVLPTVNAGELWIGDRCMCTLGFLFGIIKRGSNFVIREHKSMPQEIVSALRRKGKTTTGELFEQMVRLTYGGESVLVRRIVLKLFKPTRNGESEIAILTMLPVSEAKTEIVAELYRGRRSVENLFQDVTQNYECEIQTLGYPKAALFSFCLALVTYNILATVRAVLASVHGVGKVEAGLSDYYMAEEIQGTYRGMMIAIPPENWSIFAELNQQQLASVLVDLAARVRLSSFLKQPRAPKKNIDPPTCDPRHRHVATARLLAEAKKSP